MASETIPTELEWHRSDCLSSHKMLDNYRFLKKKIRQIKKEDLKPKPLINGNDLMAAGYKPGPVMGQILQEAYDAQLEGVIKTREEALGWVKSQFKC